MQFGRFIGIDVGTKRVGLARTDLLQTSPNTIDAFSPDESIRQLVRMNREEEYPILGFVIGWPLNPEGEEAEATRMVERYVKKLRACLPDIPIHYIDERFSSRIALRQMVHAGIPKKKRRSKGRVDQASAALFLQQFLETNMEK